MMIARNQLKKKLHNDHKIFIGSDRNYYRGVEEFRKGQPYDPNPDKDKYKMTPSLSKSPYDSDTYPTTTKEESIKRRRSLSNTRGLLEEEGKKPRFRHMSGGSIPTKNTSQEIHQKLNQTIELQYPSLKVADIAKRFSRKDLEQNANPQRSTHKNKINEIKNIREKPFSPVNPRKDNTLPKSIWR